MITSIQSHDSDAVIGLVCHDQETKELAQKWSDKALVVVGLDEVADSYPELKALFLDRPRLEFIYALSPFIVRYFLDSYNPKSVTYVDADLYFYKPVEKIIDAAAHADVGIVEHRFQPKMKHLEKFGIYNVGLVHFNNSPGGKKVLKFWQESCSNSTSTNVTSEVFGDQKYLDRFHEIGNVHVFQSAGVNAAPWNCNDVRISETGELVVDMQPLIFFHYSGLKVFRFYTTLSFTYYEWKPSHRIKKLLFMPYVKNLLTIEKSLFDVPVYDKRTIKMRQLSQFIRNRDLLIN